MLYAYREAAGKLQRLGPEAGLGGAVWIDLYRPLPTQVAAVAALGGQGGGGRPDMAQGGGPDGEKADKALLAVKEALQSVGA